MLELPAEYFRAQSQLYSQISETALQSLMTHKPASDKSDAFSQAGISVSTVIRMTPTDQSTSQEPNRVLQDTLNSFKTHFVTDFLPGNISTMETLSLAHSISEPKGKLTLFLFLNSAYFYCSGRCQSGQTNEKGEAPCSGLWTPLWPSLLRNAYVVITLLIIPTSLHGDLLQHFT